MQAFPIIDGVHLWVQQVSAEYWNWNMFKVTSREIDLEKRIWENLC